MKYLANILLVFTKKYKGSPIKNNWAIWSKISNNHNWGSAVKEGGRSMVTYKVNTIVVEQENKWTSVCVCVYSLIIM